MTSQRAVHAETTPRKPLDHEVDAYGITHAGKVRSTNQDHFLLCSLHKELKVHATSLPDMGALEPLRERLAVLAMVADGVGGGPRGEKAARLAVEHITRYVAETTRCFYTGDANAESFINEMQEAALVAHAAVTGHASEDPEFRGMATTLTLFFGVWPSAYVLQVGDSRHYLYRLGTLTQITRDQTMAQELVDQGVLTRTDAFSSRLANVLSSSIGGHQTAPVVTRLQSEWGAVHLLCSDGLTKHVSDDRIKDALANMTSAKQACEDLLQAALDDGGTDNITLIVGRAVERPMPE
ncbi:MAG TPA: protein phosphatase 2C domain-containing protein [Gemmatimonadales bacterium]|nr:protein phosphatase 2C domain-containing protein [Gemmatimonadales bacterium]